MGRRIETTREFVLRAMAAAEIAESCPDPRLRASFFELAETWLNRAAQAGTRRRAPRPLIH